MAGRTMAGRLMRHLLAGLLLLVMTGAVSAEYIDDMDATDGFKEPHGPHTLVQAEGKVAFSKTGTGDVFVFYRQHSADAWFDMVPQNDVIEIDFAGFVDGGAAEVRLALKDAKGNWKGGAIWLPRVDKPGRQTLPSARKLAAEAGVPDASAYQLIFRVKNDPRATISIDRIRVAARPTVANNPPATRPASSTGTINFEDDGFRSRLGMTEAWKVVDDPDAPGNKVLFASVRRKTAELHTPTPLTDPFIIRFRTRFDTPFKSYPDNDNVHYPHWNVALNKSAPAGGVRYNDSFIWKKQMLSINGDLQPAAHRTLERKKWTNVRIEHFRDRYNVFVADKLVLSESIEDQPSGALSITLMDADLWIDDLSIEPYPLPEQFTPLVRVRPRQDGSIFASGEPNIGIDLKFINDTAEAHPFNFVWSLRREVDRPALVASNKVDLKLLSRQTLNHPIDLPGLDPGYYALQLTGTVGQVTFFDRVMTLAVVPNADAPVAGYRSKLGFNGVANGRLFKLAGAVWTRTEAAFAGLKKNPDGTWHTAVAEQRVAALEQHPHIRAVCLYMNSGRGHLAEGIAECAAMFAAAARTFGDRLEYEVWNEPNHGGFWRLSPRDLEDFTALQKEVTLAIRSAVATHHPRQHVTIHSLSTSGTDAGYVRDALEAGIGPYLDTIAYHPYGYPEIPETLLDKSLASMRPVVADHGGWIDFHLTEQGYTSAEGGRGVPEAGQADMLVRTQLAFDAADDVRGWMIYRLEDVGTDPREVEHRFGILRTDLTPKPAYAALATLSSMTVNSECIGRLPAGETQFLQVYRRFDGRTVVAAWALKPSEVTVPANGEAMLVSPFGGRTTVRAESGGIRVALTTSPQYLLLAEGNDAALRAAGLSRLDERAAGLRTRLEAIRGDLVALDRLHAANRAAIEAGTSRAPDAVRTTATALGHIFRSAGSRADAERNAEFTLAAESAYRYVQALARLSTGAATESMPDVAAIRDALSERVGPHATAVTALRVLRRAESHATRAAGLSAMGSPMAGGQLALAAFLVDLADVVAGVERPAHLGSVFNAIPKNFVAAPRSAIASELTFRNGHGRAGELRVEVDAPTAWGGPQRFTATVAPDATWSHRLTLNIPVATSSARLRVPVRATFEGELIQIYHLKVHVTNPLSLALEPLAVAPSEASELQVLARTSTPEPFNGTLAAGDADGGAGVPLKVTPSRATRVALPLRLGPATPRHEYAVRLRISDIAGHDVGEQRLPVDFTRVLHTQVRPTIDGKLEEWSGAFPISARIGQEGFDESNLSATVWPMIDQERLYLAVRVVDDFHSQEHTGGNLWRGDSIQVSIDPKLDRTEGSYGPNDLEFGVGLPGVGAVPETHLWVSPAPDLLKDAKVAVVRDEAAKTTTYELSLPLKDVPGLQSQPGGRFGLNVAVHDADRSFTRERLLEIMPGTSQKNPSVYHTFTIVNESP
jgi:hypothetical protein